MALAQREIQVGTVWTNACAELNDGFAEGGFKQGGVARLRGRLAITEGSPSTIGQ